MIYSSATKLPIDAAAKELNRHEFYALIVMNLCTLLILCADSNSNAALPS
jgi:hypothetical protein